MKILTLFFTYDISYAVWDSNGSADREINIYIKLLAYFDKIYFITYGENDAQFQKHLPKDIIILPKKYSVPNCLYSFLIPFAYRKEIKQSTWIKTNQILGSWSAVLSKIFLHKNLMLRTGFTESLALVNKTPITKAIVITIEYIAYKFATISIVTSSHQKKYLEKKYQVNNIHIIPNGIDVKKFKPSKTAATKSPTTKMLFVGRLYKEKNVLNLINSLIDIPNIQLDIIGSGNLEKDLLKIKQANNLNVRIISNVPNSKLPGIYNRADVYIQPSLFEGNPKTILEAMSCGLPVISTDVTGINNVIKHNNTGYLCNVDTGSIHLAIMTLIIDNELQNKLQRNARNYILQNYDLTKTLGREILLYKNYKND